MSLHNECLVFWSGAGLYNDQINIPAYFARSLINDEKIAAYTGAAGTPRSSA